MPTHPVQDKAEEYLAFARAAEEQVAKTTDPLLKKSFEEIARAYREMANRARSLPDDDDDLTQQL